MVNVVYTDEFGDWYLGLDKADQEAVVHIVGLLEARGVKLGYPHSSSLKGIRHPIPLRELNVQSRATLIKIVYGIVYSSGPSRQTAYLLTGNKTEDAFLYGQLIPLADQFWELHLRRNENRLSER